MGLPNPKARAMFAIGSLVFFFGFSPPSLQPLLIGGLVEDRVAGLHQRRVQGERAEPDPPEVVEGRLPTMKEPGQSYWPFSG